MLSSGFGIFGEMWKTGKVCAKLASKRGNRYLMSAEFMQKFINLKTVKEIVG